MEMNELDAIPSSLNDICTDTFTKVGSSNLAVDPQSPTRDEGILHFKLLFLLLFWI